MNANRRYYRIGRSAYPSYAVVAPENDDAFHAYMERYTVLLPVRRDVACADIMAGAELMVESHRYTRWIGPHSITPVRLASALAWSASKATEIREQSA